MKALLVLQYSIIDFALSILYWPIWWYSKGLLHILGLTWSWIDYYAKDLAIGIWVKNIFVPMFGQRDWQSRLISIFMRSANIVIRSIILFLWTALCLTIPLLYILSLPALISFFFINILT